MGAICFLAHHFSQTFDNICKEMRMFLQHKEARKLIKIQPTSFPSSPRRRFKSGQEQSLGTCETTDAAVLEPL